MKANSSLRFLVLGMALAAFVAVSACQKEKASAPSETSTSTSATAATGQVKGPTPIKLDKDLRRWDEALCETTLGAVRVEVDKYRACKADEDCVGVKLGCPFGCPAVLNKQAPVENLKKSLVTYHKNCKCREHCKPGRRVYFCGDGRCEMRVEKLEEK